MLTFFYDCAARFLTRLLTCRPLVASHRYRERFLETSVEMGQYGTADFTLK